MSESGKAVWSLITAIAVALSVWSVASSDGLPINGSPGGCCLFDGTCENVSDPLSCGEIENSTFEVGAVCAPDNQSCVPSPIGCCAAVFGFGCEDNLTAIECLAGDNQTSLNTFVENAVCLDVNDKASTSGIIVNPIDEPCATITPTATPTDTPTSTPTSSPTDTPTSTPTSSRVPDGSDCVDPDDCESGNCVDDVCCDTTCENPDQACNVPGSVGTCTDRLRAPAPVVSGVGLIAALLVLLAVATFALRGPRRKLER